MTPDEWQKVRRYANSLGMEQSQDSLLTQLNQGVEILNACGLYDAADALTSASERGLDMTRVDL